MCETLEYETHRVERLCAQCLHSEDVRGEVVFHCQTESGQPDVAFWFFEDKDLQLLHESGFETLLLTLLDGLMRKRKQAGKARYSDGRVVIDGAHVSIEWLPDGEAARIAAEYRDAG